MRPVITQARCARFPGIAIALSVLLSCAMLANAQGGRGGGRGNGAPAAPPPTAKASAPIDLTGYWTAFITEDWQARMLTTPKGASRGRIPFKPTGIQAAAKADPAADEAEHNTCKAFGAIGIMRQPTHLHITWQDENTLKVEADFGTQTRVFHFAPPTGLGRVDYISGAYVPPEAPKLEIPTGTESSLQGYSVASWNIMGGERNVERGGDLKVVTTHLKPGYYWRNGAPYTGDAVLTEHFRTMALPDNSSWLVLVQIVEDPAYLTQPYVVNYQFKKLSDGSKWSPTPCTVH